jgi:type I restriction enzyme, S subunit
MQSQNHRTDYKLMPDTWNIVRIDSFLNINMGQSPPSESYNDQHVGLPFFQGVSDFQEIHPKPRVWCSDPKKIADVNQILLSVRAPVGEVNLTNFKCCIGRA